MHRRTSRDVERTRTGPLGRSVRLAMALIAAVLAGGWFADGMSWYADPSSLTDLRVLLLTGFGSYYVFYFFPRTAWGRRTARRSVVVLIAVAAGAAVMSLGLNGDVWSQPFTGLSFAIDGSFLVLLASTSLVAVILGTPGCEFNGLADLIHRVQGTTRTDDPPLHTCIIGLHLLDAWEAARRQAAAPVDSVRSADTRAGWSGSSHGTSSDS